VSAVDDVIARLEEATVGSYALDEAVARAVGWTLLEHEAETSYGSAWAEWVSPEGKGMNGMRFPSYTIDIQAALTLVPEGWTWMASGAKFAAPRPAAALAEIGGPDPVYITSEGSTAALAMCIVILRQRQGKPDKTL
jgi:hypothetical protein